MNKKGLSDVITIIIIVLLVIAAIAIVWAALGGLLTEGSNALSFGSLSVDMAIQSASINSSYIALVKVVRNAGGIADVEVTAIKFIVEDSRNSDIFTVDIPGGFPELASRTFELDLTLSAILNLDDIQRISIAPVYVTNTAGGVKIGAQSEPYKIKLNESEDEPPPFEGCAENSECGTDEWITTVPDFCNEAGTQVMRYKKEFTCVAGGFCQEAINAYVVESCGAEQTCYNGECAIEETSCAPETVNQDCGASGYLGFPACDSSPPPEQIVQNYREVSCVNNVCDESVTSQVLEVCEREDICSASQGSPECFTPLECASNSDCALGKICVRGSCVNEEAVITGAINSIWPFTLGEYFDSTELPKVKGSIKYVGYSIIFPGSAENRCLSIREYVYPNSTQDNSYIRLNVPETEIQSGNNFEVWQTAYGCAFA